MKDQAPPWMMEEPPEPAAAPPPAPGGGTLAVPTSALAIAGEKETVAPEPGDRVTVTIEGTVDRCEGDTCHITPETANGEPFSAIPPDAGPPLPPEDTADALRSEFTKEKVY